MSQQQIDNLLDFSTPFDAQKLQTFDLVTQHLNSNIPQSVSVLSLLLKSCLNEQLSYFISDRIR